MNCRLDNVTVTSKDGKQSVLEQVFSKEKKTYFKKKKFLSYI